MLFDDSNRTRAIAPETESTTFGGASTTASSSSSPSFFSTLGSGLSWWVTLFWVMRIPATFTANGGGGMTRVAVSDSPIKNTSTVEHSPAGGWPAFSSVESVAGTSDISMIGARRSSHCCFSFSYYTCRSMALKWISRYVNHSGDSADRP
ncbi:hypothetical protein TYRP_007408 [Tyrophagus putrescentiae]|nr:hypothetical protein TYRP_007408 [Tyrophagus putrescentiae]